MDIYKLLNINPGTFSDFPLLANRVADYQTEKVVNHNIDKLMRIKNRMLTGEGIQVNQQSIDSIISKAKSAARKQDYDISHWSVRELRIISYYLMELKNNPEYYFYALNLLEANWRDLYFNGILFYLMNSWNSIEKEYREVTCKMVCDKLSHYNGTNRRYINLKNHVNFLEENGPTRMATLVYTQHKQITEAPQILGFKSSTINQSYYSDVILKCIKLYNIDDFDLINQIFESHNLDRTKKLVFAHLVEKAEYQKDGVKQSALCRYINRTLGDVTLPSTWAPFLGATKEEAQLLKRAMQLVNIWFTQQFIETFFEECVQDKTRKLFWLSYVSYISKFKIVGSTAIRNLLQNNPKIGTMFSKHFIETNSYTSQTSALVLFIKDKVMVEFSDTGALYVYNRNHTQAKLITDNRRRIGSINDLKVPSMLSLIENNMWGGFHYREEGRMTHQGDWQGRLRGWMNDQIVNNIAVYECSNEQSEDNIFKANPISSNCDIQEYLESRTTPKDANNGHLHIKMLSDDTSTLDSELTSELLNSISEEKSHPNFVNDNGANHHCPKEFSPNTEYDLSSETINDKFKIVLRKSYFYVKNESSNKYARVRCLKPKESNKGCIWIKTTKINPWIEVVHSYQGVDFSVGYLRLKDTRIYVKESMNKPEKTEIKFE